MNELRRVVTLPQIVFYGSGNILDAGIWNPELPGVIDGCLK